MKWTLVFCIALSISVSSMGCLINNSVPFIWYFADYEDPLNLSAISSELQRHNITSKYNYSSFSYGHSFNKAPVKDTFCGLNSNDYENHGRTGVNVVLRLYGADGGDIDELQKHKPDLEDSMD